MPHGVSVALVQRVFFKDAASEAGNGGVDLPSALWVRMLLEAAEDYAGHGVERGAIDGVPPSELVLPVAAWLAFLGRAFEDDDAEEEGDDDDEEATETNAFDTVHCTVLAMLHAGVARGALRRGLFVSFDARAAPACRWKATVLLTRAPAAPFAFAPRLPRGPPTHSRRGARNVARVRCDGAPPRGARARGAARAPLAGERARDAGGGRARDERGGERRSG